MLTVSVKADFAQIRNQLSAMPAQLNQAAARALNLTAEQARSETRVQMARTFDRPTPYALNAIRVVNAAAGKLKSEVTLHGLPGGRGVSAHKFLGPEIAGGSRKDKASERRLKRAGVMPDGYQMVPGAGVQLDAYGNVPVGLILQILSWMQTYRPEGDRGRNLSAATMARRMKGTKKARGYEFFVVEPGTPGLRPGIYRRTRTAYGSAVVPILMFVRPGSYRPIFDFPQITERVVRRDFGVNLADQLRAF